MTRAGKLSVKYWCDKYSFCPWIPKYAVRFAAQPLFLCSGEVESVVEAGGTVFLSVVWLSEFSNGLFKLQNTTGNSSFLHGNALGRQFFWPSVQRRTVGLFSLCWNKLGSISIDHTRSDIFPSGVLFRISTHYLSQTRNNIDQRNTIISANNTSLDAGWLIYEKNNNNNDTWFTVDARSGVEFARLEHFVVDDESHWWRKKR